MRLDECYNPPLLEIEVNSRHYLKAKSLLSRLWELSLKKGFVVIADNSPYNVIIKLSNGEIYSVYNNGFNERLDLFRVEPRAKASTERGYVTIRGLLNYLLKIQGGK